MSMMVEGITARQHTKIKLFDGQQFMAWQWLVKVSLIQGEFDFKDVQSNSEDISPQPL